MKGFMNLRVTTKLLAFVVVMCAMVALVGYMGVSDMATANEMLDSLYTNEMVGVSHINQANTYMMGYRRAVKDVILATSHEERTQQLRKMAVFQLNLLAEIKEAAPTVRSEDGKQLLAAFWPAWQNYRNTADRIIALPVSRRTEALYLSDTVGRQAANAVTIIISRMAMSREGAGWEAHLQGESVYRSSRSLIMWVVVGLIVFAIVFGLLLSISISRSITGIEDSAEKEVPDASRRSLEPEQL